MTAGEAIVVAFMFVTLSACHSAGNKAAHKAPPPQDVTPGSTFTVTQRFAIPSGDAGVYLQDTRLYSEEQLQPNYPFCRFETVGVSGELIDRGVYTVTGVDYEENGTGPGGMDVSVTDIRLQAQTTGKTYHLNCMLPLVSYGARFVTPDEIQGAVGGYMTLRDEP